jgi:hypothetical protein
MKNTHKNAIVIVALLLIEIQKLCTGENKCFLDDDAAAAVVCVREKNEKNYRRNPEMGTAAAQKGRQ